MVDESESRADIGDIFQGTEVSDCFKIFSAGRTLSGVILMYPWGAVLHLYLPQGVMKVVRWQSYSWSGILW